ncbi:hypothetical protein [Kutzneria buriramensis]|uniref:Uncharacterized protein n=1 Tax=Kutzneria buriramensis TaxID=1045776 RepID=A0A3E0GZK5_9PSEU|nr:hypothetical protein [Kutzneria buriramensis]REH35376.1 hypothetical protein BCF44_118237 [Kutzneria buriramensis]
MASARNALVIALGLACVAALVLINIPDRSPDTDLAERASQFAAALSADAPYRPPTVREGKDALSGLIPLLTGGKNTQSYVQTLTPLGFTLTDGRDTVSGRHFLLAATEPDVERGWGMYIADYGVAPRRVIEVPHPNFDLDTEQVGVQLYQALPGSAVLIAGAHRRAAGGLADVAHNANSLFNLVADALARKGLPQVQLHGYEDRSLPGTGVVVSAGATEHTSLHEQIADRVAAGGTVVCRAWRESCGNLEGTTNVQGQDADSIGAVFAHIESDSEIRSDPALRAQLVAALVGALNSSIP